MTALPELPPIDGDIDLMLDVFTHRTLQHRTGPSPGSIHGDTDRLAELGGRVLELSITYHLFSQRPYQNPEEIEARRNEILTGTSIIGWLDAYELRTRLRVAPEQAEVILNNEAEMRKYFQIYIGAVYIRHGLQRVQNWISPLIEPTGEVPRVPEASQQGAPPPQPASSYYSQPAMGFGSPPPPNYNNFASPPPMNQYTPAPPPGAPPPLPGSPPNTQAPITNLVTLALVNQTASQRGFQVSYNAQPEGPPHQPVWTVRCTMNGVERGIGIGKSQKLAKEEAARQAWAAMGWGPS